MRITIDTRTKAKQLVFLALPGLILLAIGLGWLVHQSHGLSVEFFVVLIIPLGTAVLLAKYCMELWQQPGQWVFIISATTVSQDAPAASGDPSFCVDVAQIASVERSHSKHAVPARTHLILTNGERLWLGGNAPLPTSRLVQAIQKIHPQIPVSGFGR
jgi:hypothetical protein